VIAPRRFRWNSRQAGPRRTTRRKAAVRVGTTAVLLIAGSGAYSLQHYLSDSGSTCMNAGLTIVTREGPAGECVGVTDGSYLFSPGDAALVSTEGKIKAEDQRVRSSGKSYVTLAYLLPSAGGTEDAEVVLNQLEGAYTAQQAADGGGDFQGGAPLVQVLIASSGVDADQYRVVDADIESDVASQHLVGVAGIAISEDDTLAEVRDLTADGIPVFGSTPTSDAFDNIPGFVRVAPSNKQEIGAVLAYVKPRATRAFLIEDTNPDDLYDTSLTSAFLTQFPDRAHRFVGIQSYDSEGAVSAGGRVAQEVSNRISQMTSDICVSGADVVLFAGRGSDLITLIGDLASRPCLNRPVTIVTGDDASDQPTGGTAAQGLASGVRVYYASESDPGEWASPTGTLIVGGINEYAQSRVAYQKYAEEVTGRFGAATAAEPDTTMGYDATLTCISAIHLAGEANPAAVTASGVSQELSALQGSRTVFGASGPIDLSGIYTGTQGSNPVGKAVPILRLSAGGVVTFVELQQTSVPGTRS
jgi:ABC-type branched-subunit amino acid transport system substrate-binding protein